jgi:hypothetical protein
MRYVVAKCGTTEKECFYYAGQFFRQSRNNAHLFLSWISLHEVAVRKLVVALAFADQTVNLDAF